MCGILSPIRAFEYRCVRRHGFANVRGIGDVACYSVLGILWTTNLQIRAMELGCERGMRRLEDVLQSKYAVSICTHYRLFMYDRHVAEGLVVVLGVAELSCCRKAENKLRYLQKWKIVNSYPSTA